MLQEACLGRMIEYITNLLGSDNIWTASNAALVLARCVTRSPHAIYTHYVIVAQCIDGAGICVESDIICGEWYYVWRVESDIMSGEWYYVWRVESDIMCGEWYYVWRVILSVESDIMCGEWRVILCVESGIMCGEWYYVWRAVLCVESDIICGEWYYVWRVILCVESDIMCGERYYVWRVILCVESDIICGEWYQRAMDDVTIVACCMSLNHIVCFRYFYIITVICLLGAWTQDFHLLLF